VSQVIEAYWMLGCSSCLRMKEFIGKSGREFIAINTDQNDEARARLTEHGMVLPTIHVGDRWASGVDLAVVAELIGVDWNPPLIMPREELVERYRTNLEVGRGLIVQLTDEMLVHELPGRNRQMLDVADQVAVVIRAFPHQYYEDASTNKYYFEPEQVKTKQDVLERETWHSTHHIRQLQLVLGEFGVEPIVPLTEALTAGLPLPEGIHD
jgi:hypothetical protein